MGNVHWWPSDKGVAKRVEFDASMDGKELKRLKGVAYRASTALKRLGVIVKSSAVTSNNTSLDALLKEIEDYFDNSDEAGNDEGGDNEDNSGGRGLR